MVLIQVLSIWVVVASQGREGGEGGVVGLKLGVDLGAWLQRVWLLQGRSYEQSVYTRTEVGKSKNG